jgi:hypothetical protein
LKRRRLLVIPVLAFAWGSVSAQQATPPVPPAPPAGATPAPAAPVPAAPAPAPEPKRRWTNSTDVSLVVTQGNSDVQTVGLKNTFDYKADRGKSRFKMDALRSDTADDPFLLVAPGVEFRPGTVPTNFATSEVRPATEPDVARFFAEGRYDGNLKSKATWNAGASWETNDDAGILSRTIVFAGLGNDWLDRDDRKFRTTYGLSFTDRVEDIFDPEKEERFTGVRLTTDFMDKWGASTQYDCDFTFNVSVADASDYNADLMQGLSVNMSNHLALKVSLQLLYAGEPALEEVDVIVRVLFRDPDGIPNNGDEVYQTVSSGGTEITIGDDNIRKEQLDTIFRTSLQITF